MMHLQIRYGSLVALALTSFLTIASGDVSTGGQIIQSSYDFIIVGGGTAGLALAARLTENSNQTVLVLEAGSKPGLIAASKTPLGSALVLGTQIDWGFVTPPQASLNGRTITYHRGRCLGGSSSVNGLAYGRGSASLYDLWETMGNPGWGWKDVFPYFKKSTTFSSPSRTNESYRTFDPSGYSSNGPVQVGYPDYSTPASFSFIEAVAGVGLAPIVNDLNLGDNIGVKQEPLTLDPTYARSSSYTSYAENIQNRTNLGILTYATVSQVVTNGTGDELRAIGVAVTHQTTGSVMFVAANKEVILSAGTFQSPQLLMVSGIGPTDELARNGIEAKVGNPNVGQNLQDHTYFSVIVRSQPSTSLDSLVNSFPAFLAAQAEYAENRTGPFTSPGGATYGFQKLSIDELSSLNAIELMNRTEQAHIEYYYEAAYYPSFPVEQYPPRSNESYISITAGLLAPVSRGSVTLQSNGIMDAPVIDLNYFQEETDQKIAVYAFKQLRKILAYPNLAKWGIGPDNGEVAPGVAVQSDEDILNYIRNTAIPVWHASGTCAMKPRADGGVVDSSLKVYGVQGLRVVDASIMPVVPDQHTQGPVYMVAEKAANLIRSEYGF
ncbi:related to Versicolorin B synthase [Phialocephala subalpina]|uniref:Related to Versicolorin B synthase n=1 Tax=Phialocephala subalpina TaxID=576137 RepID=A0A1L7WY50_9HELO|nr:related to Versicolorin B synthase [Phialocephala subalpina]